MLIKVNNIKGNDIDYCFIIPKQYIKETEMKRHYLNHLTKLGLSGLIIPAPIPEGKKLKVSEISNFFKESQSMLKDYNIKLLIVTDGEIFKTVSKQKKVELFYGIVCDNKFNDLSQFIIPIPNYASLIYSPDNETKIDLSLNAITNLFKDNQKILGDNIIHKAYYLKNPKEIKQMLKHLLHEPALTIDIETYGLKFIKCGLATISFAVDKHNGCAMLIEQNQTKEDADLIKYYLKHFFMEYKGKKTIHNGGFDLTVLIYQLFMDQDTTNIDGLLLGIKHLADNFEDTKLIAYLALNAATEKRPSVGLKSLAFEFTGNYAVEDDKILNVAKIPDKELLEYNLKDTLATWFVYDKYYPIVIQDEQLNIYENIFKPALKDIIRMQLIGVSVDYNAVLKNDKYFNRRNEKYLKVIYSHPAVTKTSEILTEISCNKILQKNPNKKINRDNHKVQFNPNSSDHLKVLLYTYLNLPIIQKTKTGNPSTDGDTLESLINHTTNPETKYLLKFLVAQKKIVKILTDFMPVLKKAYKDKNNNYWVYGNFNLGGTISGRLSSSKMNLQNMPATGSPYAKTFKKMFVAPKGWLLMGLDFDSLEDKISALLTKDPNKLKVYTDGYNGHCLRAYFYFSELMPDIDPNSVESINSIAKKYPDLRNLSKSPTFALTYAGTVFTLMRNFGFSRQDAEKMYNSYHEMYKVCDEWVNSKIQEATKTGYVSCAFGLRIRTPMLKHTILGTKSTPYMAAKESRSVGNALGQSWCLLNSRCLSEFLNRVDKQGYSKDILPTMQIHDANYLLVRKDLDIIAWVNKNLPECASWQNHPDIYHDKVKLSGSVDVFYPNWSEALTLDPLDSKETIKNKLNEIGIDI